MCLHDFHASKIGVFHPLGTAKYLFPLLLPLLLPSPPNLCLALPSPRSPFLPFFSLPSSFSPSFLAPSSFLIPSSFLPPSLLPSLSFPLSFPFFLSFFLHPMILMCFCQIQRLDCDSLNKLGVYFLHKNSLRTGNPELLWKLCKVIREAGTLVFLLYSSWLLAFICIKVKIWLF